MKEGQIEIDILEKEMMKRIIAFFFAVMMIITVLTPMQNEAFADDLVNEIKGSSNSNQSCNNQSCSCGPSSADILAVCSYNEIQMPQCGSYLRDYSVMYVNAPKKLCAYVYKKPNKESEKLPYAYQGSKVTVLARESGHCCVLYTTENNVRKAGWINQGCLVYSFPGDSYDVGNSCWVSNCKNYGDAYTSWSNRTFVGKNVLYTVIDSLPYRCDKCRGMTIEYKITGRGTQDNLVREVYVNYGDGWVSHGTFTIDNKYSPVRINLYFQQPTSVKGVAVVPTNSWNCDFAFRQTVVDVLYDCYY